MPRAYCVAYGCLNSASTKLELSFFKLPTDLERRSQWLHLICREDLMNKEPKNYTVCEEHFNVRDVLKGVHRKKLKKNSLPSLRLPDLQNKDEKTQKLVEISTQTEDNLHTVYDVPIEEIVIKTEYESDHNEELDPGEEESVEPKFHLVEDLLVTLGDRLRNDNSIRDASTAIAKELVELLQTLTQGDSFDAFGRYVASALRKMPAWRAQDLQHRIVELLADRGGGDGH